MIKSTSGRLVSRGVSWEGGGPPSQLRNLVKNLQIVNNRQKIEREKRIKIEPTTLTYQYEFKTHQNTIFSTKNTIFFKMFPSHPSSTYFYYSFCFFFQRTSEN